MLSTRLLAAARRAASWRRPSLCAVCHGWGTSRLSLEAEPRLLLCIRDTPHQLALLPEERAGNVRGAFAIEPRRSGELRGRAIALVDDVMTTGSTAAEIAGVLREAGAASVAVWVVARTPRPGEEE